MLATWWEELTHLKRPWCWERLKAGGEGDDREWDGCMASLTGWTWVCSSSGSWWWTGRPGMLQSMGLQIVGHHWVIELNWTAAKQQTAAYLYRRPPLVVLFLFKVQKGHSTINRGQTDPITRLPEASYDYFETKQECKTFVTLRLIIYPKTTRPRLYEVFLFPRGRGAVLEAVACSVLPPRPGENESNVSISSELCLYIFLFSFSGQRKPGFRQQRTPHR